MKRLWSACNRFLWGRLYPLFNFFVEWLLGRSVHRDFHDDGDFIVDAQWCIDEQTPRGSHVILWTSFIAVVLLILWASFAKLDEITKGEGRVVPSREVQMVQSLDGGMVSEILVHEGQSVEAGQLLLRIDSVRFESSLNENVAQILSLKAKEARLLALSSGQPFTPPAEALKQAPEIVQQEQKLYQSRRAEMNASIDIIGQQIEQRTQELNEATSRLQQSAEALQLAQREYAVTKPLASSGGVSDMELLRLERDISRFRGERDVATSQVPRARAGIAEARRKMQEVELTFRNQASSELSEVVGKLNTLEAGGKGLQDRVGKSEIRSPLKGVVKQLFVTTVGGVVMPGKEVVEVVPTDDILLLETKVLPKDIAFLRPGQRAVVKFTAYDFSIYGGLEGTLETIGADTVIDQKGNAFYLIKVRTRSAKIGSKSLPIIPGMVAEVDILTGKKTVLSYLLKPILRAKQGAMGER